MSGRAHSQRYEAEHSKGSPAYEANSLAKLVRAGLLSVDGARQLIVIGKSEAVALKKIMEPHAADSALAFRRDVLRLFDALTIQAARARGRRR